MLSSGRQRNYMFNCYHAYTVDLKQLCNLWPDRSRFIVDPAQPIWIGFNLKIGQSVVELGSEDNIEKQSRTDGDLKKAEKPNISTNKIYCKWW